MATTLGYPGDELESALNSMFRGKARWSTQRDVRTNETALGFQCERHTPILRVNDSFFEDARSSVQLIARQCIDLYDRHHRLLQPPFAQPPILTCRECRSPVDVPSDKQQQDYEYCIEQAEAWMNRAVSMRK